LRVASYVRESADPAVDRSAFAQQEELRRHAASHGLQIIAVCQDSRHEGRALGRDGYRSLLGVINAGNIDAVLLPGLDTLSSDLVIQEIMLWDLRSRGVRILSTDPEDIEILGPKNADPARMLIRDVLTRLAEHADIIASAPVPPPRLSAPGEEDDTDIVVMLVEQTSDDPNRAAAS
jgi:DNA invertase Pin-like site-specific DNA recombinase